MVKLNELRIGNLLIVNNSIFRPKDTGKIYHILKIDSENDSVNGITIEDIPYGFTFGQFIKYLNPIPLTEEWLMKLPEDLVSEDIPSWVKYVHQLQNWYFMENKYEKELIFKD
jgi:hypothetical protein